ncbi:hypothetical protein H072_9115 [Dactylellina haptotyla CBS 200.50]|uniref:Uncharacterized protein n=1 Tax=Dactylellina haptotyla (strain CBS 200.50) TaxID=1284197 RepID=S8A7X6_DACHA|nr:hypothetical protein H072_9115 [Dactylellina haptotyla CBS 200.50]
MSCLKAIAVPAFAADLNQDLWLGALPKGLKFDVKKVTVYTVGGCYINTIEGLNGFPRFTNKDGDCVNNGNSFKPDDPNDSNGKACTLSSNFSVSDFTKPIKLCTVKFRKVIANTPKEPGWMQIFFTISASGAQVADGFFKITPSIFYRAERPDYLNINLVWSGGGNLTHKTKVRPDIGGNLGKVFFNVLQDEDGKSLGASLVMHEELLDVFASYGIQALLEINKQLPSLVGAGELASIAKVGLKLVKVGMKLPGYVKKFDKTTQETIPNLVRKVRQIADKKGLGKRSIYFDLDDMYLYGNEPDYSYGF